MARKVNREIFVTNYAKGWINKPINEVYANVILTYAYDKYDDEILLNGGTQIHVFENLPYMNTYSDQWNKSNIHHYNQPK